MSYVREDGGRREGNFLQNCLHSIDLFGRPITLTYGRKETFTSSIGGVSTIIVGLILLALFVNEMITVFTRGQATYSLTDKNLPLASDPETLELGKDDVFNFAFHMKLNDEEYDFMNNKTLVNVTFTQEQQLRNENGTLPPVTTEIKFGKCGTDFDVIDAKKAQEINIPEYFCPKDDNYTIQGTFYSNDFRFLQINVAKCVNGSDVTCLSEEQIDEELVGARFEIAFANNMVEFSNYDDPVQSFIADGNFWDAFPSLRKKTDLFIQKNHANLNKGFVTEDPVVEDFFQIGTKRYDGLKPLEDKKVMLTIGIRADDTSIEYGRTTYTLIDALAKIGGFYRIVFIAFYVLLFMFLENMFFSTVMQNIYQVQCYGNSTYLTASDINGPEGQSDLGFSTSMAPDSDGDSGNDSNNGNDKNKSNLSRSSKGSVLQAQNAIRQDAQAITKNVKDIQTNQADEPKLNDTISKLQNMIFGRHYFTYTRCDSLRYVLCACWRRENTIRKNKKFRKHKIYNIGREKIQKELDMVNIIKTMKQLKLMMKVMMPQYQRLLLKFSKANIIDDTSSGTDSDDRDNLVRMFSDTRDFEAKEQATDKVKNALNRVKEEHTELVNTKLMLGVIHKKIPEFTEPNGGPKYEQFLGEEFKRHKDDSDEDEDIGPSSKNRSKEEPLIPDKQ